MKKFIKKMAVFSLCISVVFSMVSCSNKNTAVDDPNGKVTLKMIVGGPGEQKDTRMVVDEINKQLAEKLPNTTLDYEVISSDEYADKWKLIAGSGEEVDIAWHGWMINYIQEVKQGSYMAIDELIAQYGQNITDTIPQWLFDNLKVDGKLYAIPCQQLSVSKPRVFRFPRALSEKYLDRDSFEAALLESTTREPGENTFGDEVYELLGEYLGKAQAAGELEQGLLPSSIDWISELSNYNGGEVETTVIKFDENEKPTAVDSFALDAPSNLYKYAAEYFKKGYIRKDVLTAESFIPDDHIALITEGDEFSASKDLKKGFDNDYVFIGNRYKQPINASATNLTIPRTSKNPVRAMQFLNILHDPEDTKLYNTFVYGIEGTHYEFTGENTINAPAFDNGPTSDKEYGNFAWILGNTFNAYYCQNDIPEYIQYSDELNQNATPNPLKGFKFNSDPVKTELAQIKTVKTEYKGLRYGTYSDWEAALKEYRQKIQDCGQAKVVAEMQKQLDAWYEANK